jgi:hypothetical protein
MQKNRRGKITLLKNLAATAKEGHIRQWAIAWLLHLEGLAPMPASDAKPLQTGIKAGELAQLVGEESEV